MNSSSTAYNNLDHLLRHAASNTDVSEAALHSILSSFHSPSCLDTSPLSSKHSISSKTTEALQTLLAQQQQHHYHHQKKNSLNNNNNKHCEFCCCESSEGRTCATSACLHLSSTTNATNGPISSCVTCMALPGGTTSVMGTTITGGFNQRDVEMKERLKLKLTKRNVQNLTEQQSLVKEQQKKSSTTNKKQSIQNNSKAKEFDINDQNDIDDLVRFIDGNETLSSNNNEHQTTTNESTSKKHRKKKDKQSKALSVNNTTTSTTTNTGNTITSSNNSAANITTTNNNNNNYEEIKTNSSQSKEQQQIKRIKQNRSNTTQQTKYIFICIT